MGFGCLAWIIAKCILCTGILEHESNLRSISIQWHQAFIIPTVAHFSISITKRWMIFCPLQAQPELARTCLTSKEINLSFYPEKYAFVDQPLTDPNDLSLSYLAPPPVLDNPIPQELNQYYQYPYPYPKRQEIYEDDYYNYPGETSCLADAFILNPRPLVPDFSPGLELPLSAQSVAARNRGRKITDKTRELGKIVPGGEKMNTAEMFQAASKYIK